MKYLKNMAFACVIGVTTIVVSCDGFNSKSNAQLEYQCPMKCEGVDKTYKQEGKCPVCNMEIKEI